LLELVKKYLFFTFSTFTQQLNQKIKLSYYDVITIISASTSILREFPKFANILLNKLEFNTIFRFSKTIVLKL